jgi:hypothetical protein
MTETSGLVAQLPERRGLAFRAPVCWPTTTLPWMLASFLTAVAAVGIVFAFFGKESGRLGMALMWTGRWSFLIFWLAYVGSAMAKLLGPRFAGLARRGRELGLSFASAHLVHVALVLWLYHKATEPIGTMVSFWVAVVCTYLLVLFSLPSLQVALGPRLWRICRTIALEYIALAFAIDFIFIPLHDGYSWSKLLFAIMLVSGVILRFAEFVRRMTDSFGRTTWTRSLRGSPSVGQ